MNDAHPRGRAEPWLTVQHSYSQHRPVAGRYNATDLFELKGARFREIGSGRVTMPGNSYAIDHPQPLNGTIYQDDWIGEQAVALLRRRPMDKPFFIEVSHQAPHPPMDVTEGVCEIYIYRERESCF
jgi:hypothetical protein